MVMKAYTIVEFEDGVEMVPSDWLSDDKKSCIWPNIKDQIRINTIIAKKETPNSHSKSNWLTYNVLKIFGSADTYELGKDKLKLAEQISDMGSDTGAEEARALKKSRHSRAAKNIYSSDEEGLETNYPETPASFLQLARGRQSLKSSIYEAMDDSCDGNVSQKNVYVSDKHQKNSRKNGTSTDIISKNRREIFINNDGIVSIPDQQPNESHESGGKSSAISNIANRRQSDCMLSFADTQDDDELPEVEKSTQSKPTKSLSLAGRQSSQRTVTLVELFEILKEICLKMNLLKHKMTTVEVEIRDVREMISAGQSRTIDATDLDDLGLPFGNLEAFKKFEKELLVSDFRQTMVKALKVIGGIDIPSITSKLMTKILHNSLAEEYSFKGHKGKIPFKELFNVVNLIKNVVRTHKPQGTDKDIEEAISLWLSQAKTRRLREEARKERRDAEEEAIRRRIHPEADE